MKSLQIVNQNGIILSEKAVWARNPFHKIKGLLGKKSMDSEEALIFSHASSIHTFGMHFAIDIVFLDRNHRVIKVVFALPPGRIVNCKSQVTIEFPQGRTKEKNIQEGDFLRWVVQEESGQVIVEYALLLGFLVLVILLVVIPFLSSVTAFLNTMINYLVDI